MSRRYMQCASVLTEALYYVIENKAVEQKLAKEPNIPYYVRKMCYTLALVLAMYPIQINDEILNEMKSIVGVRYSRLQEGDAAYFAEVFAEAVPSCPYNLGEQDITNRIKSKEHKVFLAEAEEHRCFIRLRNVLSNYSSISLEKLASCIHKSESETLAFLMNSKCKLASQPSTGSVDLIKSHLAINYYIDREMVHVFHMKPADKYASLLVEQIKSLKKLQIDRKRRTGKI